MYSKDHFLQQFQSIADDELVDRLATTELTDEARSAILEVLKDRGVSEESIPALISQSKKDQFDRASPFNRCDFCNKALVLGGAYRVNGQKFCNKDCYYTSRVHKAATEITPDQALAQAIKLKSGRCPKCGASGRNLEMHSSYYVESMVVLTRWRTKTAFSCKPCANRTNLGAILHDLALGWWSFYGIFTTPYKIVQNLFEILKSQSNSMPSKRLIERARLSLAEEQLAQKQQPGV